MNLLLNRVKSSIVTLCREKVKTKENSIIAFLTFLCSGIELVYFVFTWVCFTRLYLRNVKNNFISCIGLPLPEDVSITSWLGEKDWKPGCTKAAHPNSRFCAPSDHCPIMDKDWENPKGVPISAILFGGRRPQGVPLVYQSFNWQHGVFVASSLSSEPTAAAEHKGKTVMRDPFAMRPFFGYNFGRYMEHWLNMQKKGRKMPKIFHVNWFRTGEDGDFLWPGKLVKENDKTRWSQVVN